MNVVLEKLSTKISLKIGLFHFVNNWIKLPLLFSSQESDLVFLRSVVSETKVKTTDNF